MGLPATNEPPAKKQRKAGKTYGHRKPEVPLSTRSTRSHSGEKEKQPPKADAYTPAVENDGEKEAGFGVGEQ